MDECYSRVEQIGHLVNMLLGAFEAYGVLPLELRRVASVSDLLGGHSRMDISPSLRTDGVG